MVTITLIITAILASTAGIASTMPILETAACDSQKIKAVECDYIQKELDRMDSRKAADGSSWALEKVIPILASDYVALQLPGNETATTTGYFSETVVHYPTQTQYVIFEDNVDGPSYKGAFESFGEYAMAIYLATGFRADCSLDPEEDIYFCASRMQQFLANWSRLIPSIKQDVLKALGDNKLFLTFEFIPDNTIAIHRCSNCNQTLQVRLDLFGVGAGFEGRAANNNTFSALAGALSLYSIPDSRVNKVFFETASWVTFHNWDADRSLFVKKVTEFVKSYMGRDTMATIVIKAEEYTPEPSSKPLDRFQRFVGLSEDPKPVNRYIVEVR